MNRQMQMPCRCTQTFGGLPGFALVHGSNEPGVPVPPKAVIVAFAQIAAQGCGAFATLAVRKVGGDRVGGFVGRGEAVSQMRPHESQDVSDASRLHMRGNIDERERSEYARLQFTLG